MGSTLQSKNARQLILALDIEDKLGAIKLVKQAGDELQWVKIGLQMFTKFGPDYVKEIADLGKNVFLDLKLHDIPNTVAKAVESVGALPIKMLTIHACGGREMMQWALKAQRSINPDLSLLGVTVLTSMDETGLRRIGVECSVKDQIINLAGLAQEAGMTSLVCSPHEVQPLKNHFGSDLKLITPGIRPAGSAAGDQKRIMTPAKAAEAGSDYIVVGRPIYGAADPAAVVHAIISEFRA